MSPLLRIHELRHWVLSFRIADSLYSNVLHQVSRRYATNFRLGSKFVKNIVHMIVNGRILSVSGESDCTQCQRSSQTLLSVCNINLFPKM